MAACRSREKRISCAGTLSVPASDYADEQLVVERRRGRLEDESVGEAGEDAEQGAGEARPGARVVGEAGVRRRLRGVRHPPSAADARCYSARLEKRLARGARRASSETSDRREKAHGLLIESHR